jgi:hypothetical protein
MSGAITFCLFKYHSAFLKALKKELESMMYTYNLKQIVTFPTRGGNNKGTFFDNMRRNNCYSVYPMENGLLDHDAEILVLKKLKIQFQQITRERDRGGGDK